MSQHILAIHSYGSQRVKDPLSQKTVSAHKIGYSSAAADLILALYGEYAREVSSARASYRYIHITGEMSYQQGYLLLKLSETELVQAEAVARLHHRAAAYLWREGQWQELPNQRNADYSPTLSNTGPQFRPESYLAVSAATGKKESASQTIRIEKVQLTPNDKPWFWITGNSYPHRELLRNLGARWSKKRKAWYLIAWELPEAIQALADIPEELPVVQEDDAPCSDDEAEAILGLKLVPKPETVIEASIKEETPSHEEAEPEAIRIIKPIFEEGDSLHLAIQEVKNLVVNPRPRMSISSQTRWKIPQAVCGELTGSITGQVWCYGWAVHEGICVYVSLGGPRMAVEAIRARFSKGDIVNLVPEDAPAIELSAGEGNTGMYKDYMQNIPEAKFTSLILCHEMLCEPNYGGKSTTFIFQMSEEQAIAQVKHHVTELVAIPVFEEWADYLWQAGQSAMLLRKTRSGGGLTIWTLELDATAWTRLITGGLANGVIKLLETR